MAANGGNDTTGEPSVEMLALSNDGQHTPGNGTLDLSKTRSAGNSTVSLDE
jgi:hypothetical protein